MREVRTVLMTADTLGGVFTYAVTLASELAKRRVTTHLATLGALPQPEQRAAARAVPGLVLHESPWALEWMDDPWDDVARSGEWLLDLEREIRPDVVHSNGYAHAALPFAAPCIVVAHSCVLSWWEAVLGAPAPARYARYREAVAKGLHAADAVVAISKAMKSALARHYGVRACTVVPNGIATNGRPAPVMKEPFVLACGRVWDRAKNVEALTRIARRLAWPVRIAGWEADAHTDRSSHVQSLGWLGPEELSSVMARASIFALPARYEPFGLSAAEAALHGCALVLGDIPSLHEVWGDAAVFVDPSDDVALAEAIDRLARDARLRVELGERARARARLYPASRTADAMLSIYERGASAGAGALAEGGASLPCA